MSREQEAGGKIQGVGFGKNVGKTEAVTTMSRGFPSAGAKRVPVVSNREEMIKFSIRLRWESSGRTWEFRGWFEALSLLDEEPSKQGLEGSVSAAIHGIMECFGVGRDLKDPVTNLC